MASAAKMVVVEGHQLCFKLTNGEHQVVVSPGAEALAVAAENVESGDKFGLTIPAAALADLVPSKLAGDIEDLEDMEYLLCQCESKLPSIS